SRQARDGRRRRGWAQRDGGFRQGRTWLPRGQNGGCAVAAPGGSLSMSLALLSCPRGRLVGTSLRPTGQRCTRRAGRCPRSGSRNHLRAARRPCQAEPRIQTAQALLAVRALDPVVLELAVERAARDAERAGGERLVSAHGLHDAQDIAPLHLLEWHELR